MEDSILIVDDEPGVISALKRILSDDSLAIHTANSGLEGLNILKGHKIKVVISDEKMPGMSGTEFLSAMKELFPDTIRIMLTGHASLDAAMKAVNGGEIYRFFAKPWNDIELKLAVRLAIDKFDLEEENRRLLKTVKRQASELQQLEKMHPGITSLKKDDEGHFILPEIADDDEEVSELIGHSKLDKDSV